MSSQSEHQDVEIFSCSFDSGRELESDSLSSKTRVSRRVSFQLDQNGEVVAHVLGESHGSECSRDNQFIIQAPNKNGLVGGGIRLSSYANPMHSRGSSSMDSSRFLELRNQFEKLTKTKEEEINKGWRVQAPIRIKQENDLVRAGVYLQDGKFHPWFFGKITRRESEILLSDTVAGSFLVRFSEKSSSCFTLSVHSGSSNTGGMNLNGSGSSGNHHGGSGSGACSSNGYCDYNNNNMTGGGGGNNNYKHGGSIRHFLILPDLNEYKLLGSAQTFTTLLSLIHHHGYSPITKSGNELLLEVCPRPPGFTVIV